MEATRLMARISSCMQARDLHFDPAVRELLQRAEEGDEAVLAEVRALLNAQPDLWDRYGDLATHTHSALVQSLCGDNLLLRECLDRKVRLIKAQCYGPNPMDRFIVDQIITCWLQAALLQVPSTRGDSATAVQPEELLRSLEAAHRNQTEAFRTLAIVRNLLRPPWPVRAVRFVHRAVTGRIRRARNFVWHHWSRAKRFAGRMRARATWTAGLLWHVAVLKLLARWRIPRQLPPGRPKHVVMLVVSQLNVDPRVEREARALAANGFRITVICPEWYAADHERPEIDWGPGVEIRLLPLAAGRYVDEFPYIHGTEILEAALAIDAGAYHSHDLNTALPVLVAACRKRAACICDFHEWYSENVTWDPVQRRYHPHGWVKRWIYTSLERLAIRCSTEVITVCQSIGEHLEALHKAARPIPIIRNIPPLRRDEVKSVTDLRQTFGIEPDKKIVLYQGGVGPSRNLEPVIAAFAQVRKAAFVIRGPGNEYYAEGYRRLARQVGADNVFCLPPVPSAQVVAQARAADFGLWTLLANVGLNFKFSLPNKVFEYLAAGLPVIAADLPEVRRILDTYQIGVCFEPDTPSSIAEAVNRIVEDDGFAEQCRINIVRALEDLRADKEWDKLVQLYRGIWGINVTGKPHN
jgi:glycosyltransferase involved in cell wall biosynthesis